MSDQKDFVRDENRASSKFITGVFGWMFLGLLLSAVSAVFTALNFKSVMFMGPTTWYVYGIAEIVLVMVLSWGINKLSPFAAGFLFIVYAVVNGLTLSTIFLAYDVLVIIKTFAVCAAMFLGMVLYGLFTKNDLSRYRTFFIMGLFGIIIAGLINWLSALIWGNGSFEMIDLGISMIAVVLFAGLTAYDTQKFLRMSDFDDGSSSFAKYSIIGALELYLDFINMFLRLLRIFGRKK